MKYRHCWLSKSTVVFYVFLFLLISHHGVYAAVGAQNTTIDSLKKVMQNKLNPAEKIQTMFALGKEYLGKSDLDNALINNTKLLELISVSGTKKDSAKIMRYLGLVYMKKSLYSKSLDYLMKAQRLYAESGDSSLYATTHMNIGIIHDYMDNFPMALMYYNNAHNYFERHNDESGMANCGVNISIVLTRQKKYNEACKYLLEISEIYKKLGNETYLAASYINLALAYKRLEEFDKSLIYMDKAYVIYKKNDEKENICVYHLNMGEILLKMNRADEAGVHLFKAKELSEIVGSQVLVARSYDYLSDYGHAKKDYKFAFEYLKKSKSLNDSIVNAETVEKVSHIQYKYEISQREADNEHLVKENLNKKLQLSQKNIFLYILSSILLLIALLVGFLYNQNRIKRRANALLEEKNHLIEKQKESLVMLNASKDKFLSILAHDIKNPLGSILGISELLDNEDEKLTKEEKIVFTKDIHTLAANLFEIINTLLSWAVFQGGLTAVKPHSFNIRTLVEKVASSLSIVAKQKNISIHVEGESQTEVFADENMLLSILHNLIGNAIKFTFYDGEIKIKVQTDGKEYALISVIDKGTGLSPKSMEKLFRYDQHFLKKGTAGELGTGLGLILCKDFVEKNGGKMSVQSELNEGSTFSFTIPLPHA